MSALIAARLPTRTAHEAMTTGRRYGGTDAAAAGIVHETAGEGELLARALELAGAQAPKNPDTLRPSSSASIARRSPRCADHKASNCSASRWPDT